MNGAIENRVGSRSEPQRNSQKALLFIRAAKASSRFKMSSKSVGVPLNIFDRTIAL
jgi:hypothetical protein